MTAEHSEAKPKKSKKMVFPNTVRKALFDLLMSKPRHCEGIGGETLATFYSENPAVQQRVIADFCSGCAPDTRAACLEFAIVADEPGIWGGTTKKMRSALRRSRLRQMRRALNEESDKTQEATVIPTSH